jgi:hypothetical protein
MRLFGPYKGSCGSIRNLRQMISVTFSVALLFSTVGFAQGVRGTITGQVKDPTGAVVPGASVKLINLATGQVTRTAQTNGDGVYELVEVEPATYNLDITAAGFSEVVLQNAVVEPNRHLTLDATMAAAGAIEQVTVSAGQELLDRDSATLGTTVDNLRVEGLPLDGREILNLALLQPGVIPTGDNGASGVDSGAGFRVNGARGNQNNFTIGGANNNEEAVGSDLGNEPRPDAVQEFRLLTSNYEAEFGRNVGSVVNVVIKSGTDKYHGDARIFWRPTFLSAAEFFDNLNGLPKRRFERKDFGGNFGGPLPLPMLDRGKQKTFFFFDYEQRAQLLGATDQLTEVPTQAMLGGNFSALLQPNNEFSASPIKLINPFTNTPYPGNIIPPSMISPIAKFYYSFLPAAPASGRVGVQGNQITNNNYATGRLDHTISDKQTISFIANYFQQDQVSAFGQVAPAANVPGFGEVDARDTYNYIFQHTYSITPTIVNSLLLSYARNNFPAVAPQNTTTPSQIGFTANFVAQPKFAGPPFLELDDEGLLFGNDIQGPQARLSQNYQIQDSVSWVKGNHRLKFGADGTKYFQPEDFLFINQGIFQWSAQFNESVGLPTTGLDIADVLIGLGPIAQQYGAGGERNYRQLSYSFFGQDAWKVKDNLTLSYGLRWDYIGAFYDKLNEVAYYRPGETSQLVAQGKLIDSQGQKIITGGGIPVDGLVYPGDPDNILGGTVPNGGYNPSLHNFAPRLGIAYSPRATDGTFWHRLIGDNATVIRGGWGIYYDGASLADTQLQQLTAPGYNGTNAFFFPTGGTLANPFAPSPFGPGVGLPTITNPFSATTDNVSAPLAQFARPIDPHLGTPYTYQYNLTIERSFHKNYVVSVSYVSTRGVHLYASEQINPSLGTFLPFADSIASPAPFGGYPAPTQANANSRRENPDITVGLGELVTAGSSWFNALEAQVQKRFSNGLLFQASYTWSKSIDNSDNSRGLLDLLDRNAGKGLSGDDQPQRFVLSWIYDLPFFRHSEGAMGRLLGGFRVGGIATFTSGTPFTVGNPFDIDGTGGALVNNADLGQRFQLLNPETNNTRAFNTNNFVAVGGPGTGFNLATDFRRGTEGVNQFFEGNGFNNWDLTFSKITRMWSESTSLELRLDVFNAFNHTQFTNLDLNLLDPNFGDYTSTRQSRVLQLAARIKF